MATNRKEYEKEYYLKNRDKYLQRSKSPEKKEYNKQYKQRIKEQKQLEVNLSNQSFIEENDLREHPILSGYYGTKSGRVFSNKGSYGSIREIFPAKLKMANGEHGYHLMNCHVNGVRHQILQHQFIAQIFIPNPNNYLEINHKDENKSNNSVENLEWCSRLHNISEFYNKKSTVKLKGSKTYIIKNLKTGEQFKIYNLSQWCREQKIRRSAPIAVLLGKQNTFCKKTYTITKTK
tara:strand:- start:34 stop:735 length:702 start_codon:yes stop_codon:yes gene_type:complete